MFNKLILGFAILCIIKSQNMRFDDFDSPSRFDKPSMKPPRFLCRCANIDAPVCGMNYKTYGNACLLACDGMKMRYEGRCKKPGGGNNGNNGSIDCTVVRCGLDYNPVCGNENITYRNRCIMECVEGDTLQYMGECTPKVPCIITLEYAPVCGVNGQTYSNMASLQCDRMSLDYKGKCKMDLLPIDVISPPNLAACSCLAEYKPVCGVNGKTYNSQCLAGCEGVAVQYQGACNSSIRNAIA